MTRRAIGQRGQAMVEALLLLPVLALVWLGIAWLGKAQYTALTLIQASRQAAMSTAMGRPLDPTDRTRVEVTAAAGADGWRDEWSGEDARRVWATSQAVVNGSAAWGGILLARRVGVAAGAGNARNEQDAQRRIGLSARFWGQVAADSISQVQALAPAIQAVDRPWRRPPPSEDWLSAWADVLPAERGMGDGRAFP